MDAASRSCRHHRRQGREILPRETAAAPTPLTKMRRVFLAVLFFVVLVAMWAAIVRAQIWSPVLLPSPGSVFDYLVNAGHDDTLLSASLVTVRRLLVGYLIGLAIGLPLGLLTASLTFVEDTIGVLALGLQTLPSVCSVPLALLWFGQT